MLSLDNTQAEIGVYCSLVFVCVAALAILDRLEEVDQDTLAWWLAERQLPNGGLNGRPEKLEDVGESLLEITSWVWF